MNVKMIDWSYDLLGRHLNNNDARIFEIGCRLGNITKYLLSKSNESKIHATNVSPNMIALAKKNNPTTTFEVMDCRNIRQIKTTFDAIVIGFCLPYITKEDFISY